MSHDLIEETERMAARLSGSDLRNQLNTLSMVGVVGDLTDGQLLERFLSSNDGGARAAFTALVERHGPMVLGVCREARGTTGFGLGRLLDGSGIASHVLE
jgi:hypothetical protein